MADKNSPNIIFALEAHLPGDDSAKNAFYRCKGNRNIIDYLTRFDAVDSKDLSTQDLFEDYLAFTTQDVKTIVNYATNRPGSTGSFTKDKLLEKDDMKEIAKKLGQTESIIWSSVISFTPELAEKCCYNRKMAQEIMKTHLPILFKESHLKYDNIEWFGSFHINESHPHIHLIFWEKEPKYRNSKGQVGYNTKFKIDENCFRDFKFSINREFSSSKLDYLHLRDEIRSSMRLNYGNNKRAFDTYYSKCENILDKGVSQYGRLTNEDKNFVDSIVKDIINNNPQLKKIYSEYTNALFRTQEQYAELYKKNKMKVPEKVNKFYNNRVGELHNRLGNEFLKLMKDYAINKLFVDGSIKKEIERSAISSQSDKYIRIKRIKTRNLDQALSIIEEGIFHFEDEMRVSCNNLERFRREELSKGVELIHNEEQESGASIP